MRHIAFTMLLLAVGCSPEAGPTGTSYYEFRNLSDQTIWVNEVTGFALDPSCGLLPPSAERNLGLPYQRTPDEFVVEWWYGTREEPTSERFRQTLSEPESPELGRDNMLVFEFLPDESWQVRFEPR